MTITYGWISHVDPLTYDPNNATFMTNGFALFLTQVCIIIILCRILGTAFQKIGQPAVVGELVAGILLGPTAFGNVPGFTATIIPPNALPLLKLMANIGLSLFLFLVGLETDTDLMAKYWKQVAIITLPGMAIPFAVAVGIARLIWQLETDQSVKFTTFFLFVGTVMAVTSLSVLSRIMAEMRILSTKVGAITIAAGVCNDLIGYMLLALGSALGSGGAGIVALYELLAAAGFIAGLWFIYRPIMNQLLLRSGFDQHSDKEQKVPEHLLAIGIIGALVSAFYTDSIGVHPITGAFAFGVCCPHGAFAVKVTESIETLVMGVMLPLYFVTSGLSTDFKLLDTGRVWGLIVLLVAGIFISKFGATTLSARAAGLTWRQSMCVGSLMQSKGIIEIIILNVALSIGVVDKRVFAMLVIVFICTTVTVRPMSRFIYFSRAQDDSEGAEEGEKSDGTLQGETSTNEKTDGSGFHALAPVPDFPITVAITSPNPNIVALMTLLSIAGGGESHAASLASISSEEHEKAIGRVAVDLIRLLPLDYSTSSIMKLIVTSTDRRRDEMLETLKAFAGLIGVPTSASLAAERALFHETQHGGATITQHHALESVPLPADTFPVPDGERIEFIAKCNARAQNRLRVGSVPIDGSALGHGLTIVAWESSNAVARSLSWLGTAAAASGLSPADSEEEAFWRADADAHALPARLFRQLDSATGVLVDRQVLEHHADLPSRVRSQADLAKRARFERELGIVRTTGRRRVIVPFFGGADDRAAVELVKKLAASSGAIDAFVVAMLSTYAANDLGLLSMSSAEGGNSGTAALQHPPAASHLAVPSAAEAETHEAENQESINLRTIHRADMDRLDTLFLRTLGGLAQKPADQTIDEKGEDRQIARSSSSGSASEGVGAGAKPTNLSMTTPRPTVRVDSGVTFITLPSYGEGPIGSILSALLPLIDDLQDLVLVGRGKLAQRPKSFRAEVQAMHAAAASVATSNANADAENNGQRSAMGEGAKAELVQMGRTLGAAAEGLLLGGVTASLLVVQARRE